MTIIAAADGSALGNPGPAGWAWYVDDSCWRAGGWPHGTNNQGELMAVLDLFRSTAHVPQEELRILCDSQYVINCITKWMPGWKRKGWRKADGKPVLNVELLKDIDQAINGRTYTFEWVKGHAGHDLNEAADERARAVALAFQQGAEVPSGPGYPGGGVEIGPGFDDRNIPSVRAATAATAFAPHSAQGMASGSVTVETAMLFDDDEPQEEDLTLFGDQDVLGEPTLFTAFGEDGEVDAELAQGSTRSDEDTVVFLERELLDPEVRGDIGRTGVLLHPDFTEIGSSGRVWSRDEVLMALEGDPGERTELEVLSTDKISADTVLLSYRSYGRLGSVLRTSIWVLDDARWRLRFHQSTPEK
ncbi:RNase H family protein [bacterium RCC_150]